MTIYDKFIGKRLAPKEQETLVKNGFVPKVTKIAARLPMSRKAVAAYNCFCDSSVPTRIKAAIVVPLAYFVVPIDLIPDLIPALGFTDDVAALGAAWMVFSGHVTDHHYKLADDLIEKIKNGSQEA